MEKQQHNQTPAQLLEYRRQIDEIDEKIIDLLKSRMEIVGNVKKFKEKTADQLFIKSAREATIIKNLVEKIGNSIPKSVIVTIWRKIITSANFLEQNIKIGLYNSQNSPENFYLTQEYYGDFIEIINFENLEEIFAQIAKNNIQLAVFALPKNSHENQQNNWWIELANQKNALKIFAKFPFIKYEKNQNLDKNNLVVLGIKEAEESGDDKTILVVKLNENIAEKSLRETLEELKFSAKIIANSEQNYLVEIDGFFKENHEKIQLLQNHKLQPKLKIVGHYPNPIIVKS